MKEEEKDKMFYLLNTMVETYEDIEKKLDKAIKKLDEIQVYAEKGIYSKYQDGRTLENGMMPQDKDTEVR